MFDAEKNSLMQKRTLTLIVPGLIDSVLALNALQEIPIQELPALTTFSLFLSRGQITIPQTNDLSDYNLYTCLLDALPLDLPLNDASILLPIANISMHYDSQQIETPKALNNKWIMRIDPCFMVADRDQLVLAKTGDMDLSLQEAKQLAEEIKQFYSQCNEEIFWTIKVLSAERWYLISDKPITIDSVPPEKVLGQSVKPYLFRAKNKEQREWLNLFNEFQMILHQSPINKIRQKNNKLPINSLWFWGQSEYTSLESKQNKSLRLYSHSAVAKGLAFIHGGESADLPEHYLASPNDSHHCIYVIDDFSRALQNKDIFQWVGLLEAFEQNYLVPILHDIKAGHISHLELISPTGRKLLITKKLLARWWKKKKIFINFFIKKI